MSMTPYLDTIHVRNEFLVEPEPSDREMKAIMDYWDSMSLWTDYHAFLDSYSGISIEPHMRLLRRIMLRYKELLAIKTRYRNRLTWGSDE